MSAYVLSQVGEGVRDIPGVARLEANRFRDVLLGDGSGPVTVSARPITGRGADDVLWLEERADQPMPEGLLPAWIPESAADLYRLESDSRGSTGTIYWEGAVRARDANGDFAGRGYLELTGYGEKLQV